MLDNKKLIYLRIITTTLLIIGGIAWGILGSLGFNPISRGLKAVNAGFLSRTIYSMVGLSAVIYLYFFYNSRTFLPFLSEAAFPSTLISQIQPKNYNQEVTLNAPHNAKMIVFWAAEPVKKSDLKYEPISPLASKDIDHRPPDMYQSPQEAYDDFENAGSAQVENGTVTIHLQKPSSYKVRNKTNPPHVHYRWVLNNAMLSEVNTLYL